MKRLLLLALMVSTLGLFGWGAFTETVPPACLAADLADGSCGVPAKLGTVARVTDADSAAVCTNSGAGAVEVLCVYAGSGWIVAASGGGTFTGALGETITNSTNSTFTFTMNSAGTVTLTSADSSAPHAGMTLDAGGDGPIIIGSGDVDTVTIITDGGTITLDGDISTPDDITSAVSEAATFGAPNKMTADRTALNQFVGIPKLNVTQSGAALPDGTATAALYEPLAAVCVPITAGTEADDAVNYITGAASYEYTAQATAADNDGFDCDVTGHANVGTDSIGFWIQSDTALTAGTLDVSLVEVAGVKAVEDLPAITVVDEWQWIEIDFAAQCDADCADIDGVFIQVTAAGAATDEMDATVILVDTGAFWLDTAELAIGDVQVGGVISVSAGVTGGGDTVKLAELTDYIVNYQTGADALVFITDQDANYGTTLEALD